MTSKYERFIITLLFQFFSQIFNFSKYTAENIYNHLKFKIYTYLLKVSNFSFDSV